MRYAAVTLAFLGMLHCQDTESRAALVQFAGNGHYYEAVLTPNGTSWTDAKLTAESRGGYLATVHSSNENDFLFGLIDAPSYWSLEENSPFSAGAWIGGFQVPGSSEPDGGYRWVTPELWSFTAWASGEPNDGAGAAAEDAVVYWTGNTPGRKPLWNDLPSAFLAKSYLVEWDSNPVPEPCTLTLALFVFVTGGKALRRIHQ